MLGDSRKFLARADGHGVRIRRVIIKYCVHKFLKYFMDRQRLPALAYWRIEILWIAYEGSFAVAIFLIYYIFNIFNIFYFSYFEVLLCHTRL